MGRSFLKNKYNTELIESDNLSFDINTREELKQIEIEEFGQIGLGINWNKWDEIQEKTKKELKKIPTKEETKLMKIIAEANKVKNITNKGKETYVYNIYTKELVGVFKTQMKAAKALGMPPTQVGYCISIHGGISRKWGYFFTTKPVNINKL